MLLLVAATLYLMTMLDQTHLILSPFDEILRELKKKKSRINETNIYDFIDDVDTFTNNENKHVVIVYKLNKYMFINFAFAKYSKLLQFTFPSVTNHD